MLDGVEILQSLAWKTVYAGQSLLQLGLQRGMDPRYQGAVFKRKTERTFSHPFHVRRQMKGVNS